MQQGRYAAADSPEEIERERLAMLEEMGDPLTRQRLESVGLAPGWRCLEVAAGRGSIARWLAEKVGPEGRVVAADLNPRFLTELRIPNLEVRHHDVLAKDFEAASYDLVHCRALLMHLPRPIEALRRMAEAVRPGGWLVVEEGDFGSFGAVDDSHPGAETFNRVTNAIWEAMRRAGVMDSRFGRRLPGLFRALGFEDVAYEGLVRIGRGGDDPVGRFWALGARIPNLNEAINASGIASREDLERVRSLYEDPSFEFLSTIGFSAWGRRPASWSPPS